MKKNKKLAVSKEILLKALGSAVEFMGYLNDLRSYQTAPYRGGREYIAAIKRAKERQYVLSELARLKRQKFLESKKVGNRIIFSLTGKGMQEAVRQQIIQTKAKSKDKFCIVIFDIPESERGVRNFFRRFLKEAGFIRLQQSVWVSEKDVFDQILKLIKIAGADKWIQVIVAEKISNFKIKD